MTTSSPVPIPSSKQHKPSAHSQTSSAIAQSWGHHDSHLTAPDGRLALILSTSCPYPEICSPTLSDLSGGESVKSPQSPFPDCHDYHPFSPPRLRHSPSSSTLSSLSSPSTTSSKLTRAFSPPREPVFANDPLCIFEDPEESCSDDNETHVPESHHALPPLQTSKKLARRKSQFRSSLTASLKALKGHLPNSLPQPTIYTPALVPSRTRSHSVPQTLAESQPPLSVSLPAFASLDPPLPTSSAVHLQTYSVSLGPPRKPREARLNGDFLRLLALEMEMRRSGKFGSTLPEHSIGGLPNQGIVVSGKVRMILPRRSDKERDDVNMSTFNKSRLKW